MALDAGRMARLPRVAPFAGATALAWLSVLVGARIDWTLYAASCALLVVAVALRVWRLGRIALGVVPSSLVFLAAVAALRGSAGGISSGVGAVSIVPVFYVAMYGERASQLYAVVAGVAAFFLAPILLVGPPEYPSSQYRAALLMVAVSAIVGHATRRLVEEIRRQGRAAREHGRRLEEVNAAISDLASTDPLTGLPNRRAWDAHLARMLETETGFTVAMLDLDHFKEFNDAHGHPAGDRLLKETASIWRGQLRTGDLLARLGGEEFGLLLLDCDPERVLDLIERLRALVCGDRTCSAGFATWRPGESPEALLTRADRALYEAKESGRDRACMSA